MRGAHYTHTVEADGPPEFPEQPGAFHEQCVFRAYCVVHQEGITSCSNEETLISLACSPFSGIVFFGSARASVVPSVPAAMIFARLYSAARRNEYLVSARLFVKFVLKLVSLIFVFIRVHNRLKWQ